MSRRRYLSTEVSFDGRVDQLARETGDFAALLYTWMIPHAEDDGSLPADPRELRARVVPHRNDKTVEDVAAAIEVMVTLHLLERDGKRVFFPPAAFFRYQTYVPEAKRRRVRRLPSNSEKHRQSARNAADQRGTPQNAASLSPSPSPSLSLSSTSTPPLPPSGEDRASPQALADLWNQIIGTPKVSTMTKTRLRAAKTRLREHPDLAWWRDLFNRISRTPNCRGAYPSGWVVDFDWVIANDLNAVKVLEGKYDGKPAPVSRPYGPLPSFEESERAAQALEKGRPDGH
jgi:hypothetical protein